MSLEVFRRFYEVLGIESTNVHGKLVKTESDLCQVQELVLVEVVSTIG